MNTEQSATPDWKSFRNLVGLQTQNAFNDKMAQFLIIPLAFWLTSVGTEKLDFMPHLLAVLIVLPYLLLAPLAGWLSDRFPKSLVIRWSAIFQTLVLSGMFLSVVMEQIWGAVACFFILSIQSTLLNPAKRGIIKELVGEKNLGSASGLLEMSVVLAVCAGQIIAGFWFAHEVGKGSSGWEAMKMPLQFLLAATAIPIILSLFVQNTGAKGAPAWSVSQGFSHFSQLSRIWKERNLRLCALGKSFFWGCAGVLNLWQIAIAKDIVETFGGEYGNVLSCIMLAASGGIILGGVGASLVSRKKIELGLIPLGGMIMLAGVILLACSTPGTALMYLAFMTAGVGGAIFLVPINGQLQNLAPANERGKILAGASVLDCVMGLSAVAFQYALTTAGLEIWVQCVILAVIITGVLIYLLQILPKTFVRFIIGLVLRTIYKVRVKGVENMPMEGGVLLTPNHVSYIDSMVLSLACPRPVRFLMIRDCFDTPVVGKWANYFDTIPISRERAKEAIMLAAQALKEGTVVCIFPEGQLTRTGALCEMKRGFEMIARQAKCPVVPVYMDGLWGTLTSFEREKMYWKVPRFFPKGIRVHIGEAVEGKANITRQRIGGDLHRLGHEAMYERVEVQEEKWIRKRLKKVNLPKPVEEQISKMPWEKLQEYVFNALQLREMGVFRDGRRFGIEEGTGAELSVSLLAAICGGSIWYHPKEDSLNTREITKCDYLFFGERIRPDILKLRRCLLIDVNGHPVSSELLEPKVYPALIKDGMFQALSMPHPNKIQPHDPLQPGWKHNSIGRILPGSKDVPEECDEEFFLVEAKEE